MEKIKFCRTCALADPENLVCQLLRMRIDLDKDFCSRHTTEDQLGTCAYCGQMYLGAAILEQAEDGSFIELCPSCNEKFGTCHMCSLVTPCRLVDESYKPQIPIAVMKRFQKGNMVVQKQIINPDRIQQICVAECECWDGEGCARHDFGCCAKYNQKTVN